MSRKSYLIEGTEYESVHQRFESFLSKINSQIFNSIFDEKARKLKIKCNVKVFYPLDTVFKIALESIIHSLNALINVDDVSLNKYFKSSNKNKNIIFKIDDFEENNLISIIWITNNQLSRREYRFSTNKNNNITKIFFCNSLQGLEPVIGLVNMIKKKVYVKEVKKSFKNWIQDIKIKIM